MFIDMYLLDYASGAHVQRAHGLQYVGVVDCGQLHVHVNACFARCICVVHVRWCNSCSIVARAYIYKNYIYTALTPKSLSNSSFSRPAGSPVVWPEQRQDQPPAPLRQQGAAAGRSNA